MAPSRAPMSFRWMARPICRAADRLFAAAGRGERDEGSDIDVRCELGIQYRRRFQYDDQVRHQCAARTGGLLHAESGAQREQLLPACRPGSRGSAFIATAQAWTGPSSFRRFTTGATGRFLRSASRASGASILRRGWWKQCPPPAERKGDFSSLLAISPAYQIYDPYSTTSGCAAADSSEIRCRTISFLPA